MNTEWRCRLCATRHQDCNNRSQMLFTVGNHISARRVVPNKSYHVDFND
jgi:hypothetical protein